DEDGHMVLQQLGRVADGVLRRNHAVGPYLDAQLVIVGYLAQARGIHRVVHLANGGVDGVDRDVTQSQIIVEILFGADVAAAGLEPHLDVQLAALADSGNVEIAVEKLHIGASLDLAAQHHPGLVREQADDLVAVAVELEGDLLQVQNDVGGVLDYAGDGTELVQHALDLDGRDGGAFNGAQQHPAQSIADGGAEPPLEGLRPEFSVLVGQRVGIRRQPL